MSDLPLRIAGSQHLLPGRDACTTNQTLRPALRGTQGPDLAAARPALHRQNAAPT